VTVHVKHVFYSTVEKLEQEVIDLLDTYGLFKTTEEVKDKCANRIRELTTSLKRHDDSVPDEVQFFVANSACIDNRFELTLLKNPELITSRRMPVKQDIPACTSADGMHVLTVKCQHKDRPWPFEFEWEVKTGVIGKHDDSVRYQLPFWQDGPARQCLTADTPDDVAPVQLRRKGFEKHAIDFSLPMQVGT
jgi:hypothetical protein